MKKLIIISFMFSMLAAQGQVLNVTSIERLNVNKHEGQIGQAVAISPQGDYLLLSTDTKQGLVKWDFETGQSSVLTTESITSSGVSISEDGSQVNYEEVSYKNRRRLQAEKTINLANGKKKTVSKAKSQRQAPAAIKTSGDGPVLTHHHLKLYITRDGVTRQLAPNGEDERYIWSSLSPDGSKVLYYVSGQGAFVCDLDGNHVTSMGDITAPEWWDDNTIVGMHEMDDEYTVIASSIVARTLDGAEQTLTGDDVIATYPLPCRQAGKIAFSTPSGDIYVIEVRD